MRQAVDCNGLQVEIETKKCGIPYDERARLQQGLERLAQEVKEFPESALHLTVVYHPKSAVYHARARLRLPGTTLFAGSTSPWLDDALSRVVENMDQGVKRYAAEPDEEAVRRAERRAQISRGPVAPVEADGGAVGATFLRNDYVGFRRALAPLEEAVRDDVGRWIQRYPEVQALIGQLFNTNDIVEEVFLMAFERYGERSADVPILEWLHELIDPAIKSLWHEPEEREAVSYAQSLAAPASGNHSSQRR